jgi:two-component system phosphate regulon sensor histidine kinase PhoR
LRTPLTTIKGYADLLEDGVLGPLNEEQRDKLAKISAGVDRLTKIVDNLSDLSSIASRKYTMDILPVSLNDLIGEVARGIAFLAERKGIRLSWDVPVDLPMVYVDRARISQVILNIVNNAIKYTPPGGSITIRAKDKEDYVLVSVHDTGIGIPKKDLENIFSGFYHAGYKLSYEYKGAGLGLALSKGIIESHGGRIWAESEAGKGSTFYFTLPKSAPKKK